MRILCYIFLSFLFVNCLSAQSNQKEDRSSGFLNIKDPSCDSVVLTPFGRAAKSHIHFISNKFHVNNGNSYTEIVQNSTGRVIQKFAKDFSQNKLDSHSPFENETEDTGMNFKDGWITYGSCEVFSPKEIPISLFDVKWIVPSDPIMKSNQLIYIFCGLQAIESGVGHIVQPVLQWGISPAGGGNYWAICNWYVSSDYNLFYDSLIKVNPGTSLEGKIRLTSTVDTLFNYISSFEGYSEGLQVNSLPELTNPYVVFESYYFDDCAEFPPDEKIRMFNIILKTDTIYPPLKWLTSDNLNTGQNTCNQYTKVISESSYNGEVDLHLHSPADIGNFNKIHIYPDPCDRLLHISPKELLRNCTIQIFNLSGVIQKSDYIENMESEFNLDLTNLASGIYFIRFFYNNSSHTFKFIKR
jgi:hypothetical protein